jgi:hypothetical protein
MHSIQSLLAIICNIQGYFTAVLASILIHYKMPYNVNCMGCPVALNLIQLGGIIIDQGNKRKNFDFFKLFIPKKYF